MQNSVTNKRPKPMPANVAAIWGAFLYEGLLACSKDIKRDVEVLLKWQYGSVDLMAAACAFLPEVWRQIEPHWYQTRCDELHGADVFEHEVITLLGIHIGDYLLLHHGELPPRELVKTFAQELIKDFLSSGENYETGILN